MKYRSKQAAITKLLECVDAWVDCPAYERSRIVGWVETTGQLVEQCDQSDLQGARIPFNAAADLLTEVALSIHELQPILQGVLEPITCAECDNEVDVGEASCARCAWLGDLSADLLASGE